jgi:hypothetical protein
MNANTKGSSIRAALFTAALMAVCLFAGSANAQSAFHGTFTLQHEIHWGDAVLPAGNYVIDLDRGTGPSIALIRNAATDRPVAMVASAIVQSGARDKSALVVGSRGRIRVVRSFQVAELGEVFIYDRPLDRGEANEEAKDTSVVPILQAKK